MVITQVNSTVQKILPYCNIPGVDFQPQLCKGSILYSSDSKIVRADAKLANHPHETIYIRASYRSILTHVYMG